MIKIWSFHDPTVPQPIKKSAWRGGDEDWIVVEEVKGEFVSWEFRTIVERLDRDSDWDERTLFRLNHEGKELFVYTVCHA